MRKPENPPRGRDSNKTASGKHGAVHGLVVYLGGLGESVGLGDWQRALEGCDKHVGPGAVGHEGTDAEGEPVTLMCGANSQVASPEPQQAASTTSPSPVSFSNPA